MVDFWLENQIFVYYKLFEFDRTLNKSLGGFFSALKTLSTLTNENN